MMGWFVYPSNQSDINLDAGPNNHDLTIGNSFGFAWKMRWVKLKATTTFQIGEQLVCRHGGQVAQQWRATR